MEIRWKQGSAFKAKPEAAYKEIETIRKKNGGEVTADAVVERAKALRNPLHNDFEWDDSVAAREHRLATARYIMRSFVVVRKEIKTDRPQRVYGVVKQPQVGPGRAKHVYQSMDDILSDVDLRSEFLSKALSELLRVRNKYRDLQELAVVMRAIDEVLETSDVA